MYFRPIQFSQIKIPYSPSPENETLNPFPQYLVEPLEAIYKPLRRISDMASVPFE